MKRIFINIKELAGIAPAGLLRRRGAEMSEFPSLENAWLSTEDGVITGFGEMASCPLGTSCPDGSAGIAGGSAGSGSDFAGSGASDFDEVVDASGCFLLPSFCDSHTHIVYAGTREGEFIDKINGLSYEEIAARGGGILNSADLLHATSEDSLYGQSLARVREMMAKGSGAIEIKSGYGLSTEDELKMLRVIRRLREAVPAVIRATFLGAHAVGRAYAGHKEDYVRLVCEEMLPAVAAEGLADFVDVFCDEGFFTPEDTAKILEAGARYGLRPKVHVDEIAVTGGMEVALRFGALSVDHLERTGSAGIGLLKGSDTMPTMLPGSSFFLGLPYGKARDFIGAGLGLALASDYNPGSSPSGDMRFVLAQGCIKMRLTPSQALNACTLNGAYAMGASGLCGSITVGKLANLILTEPLPSLGFIPYCYTTPFIRKHYLRGEAIA